ncbi:MAG: sorbosone dehydrogenase family protein [Fimbriimonas sp.]
MIKLLLVGAVVFGVGCGSSGGSVPEQGDTSAFKLETVVTGLEVPWSIVFGPDGEMYVTERKGRVRVVKNGTLQAAPIFTVPDVVAGSEIGLMGMALHPNFQQNRYAYLAYGYRSDADKVVRYKLEANGTMSEDKILIQGIPAAMNHAGCQLGFGPDGKLYITTGDATDRQIAQDMYSLGGKTLRLNDDGSIPSDNPFVGEAGKRSEIWSYGHRNSQGIAWQPGTGAMWQTEHGPSGFDGPGGGDEVNVVTKGANMGWPLVHHDETKAGTVAPIRTYTPAEAPGAATFYNADRMPQFKGNFFFCCLRGTGVMRLVLDGQRIVKQEKLFPELGRCRAIAVGPDGAIYFSTSNRDGRGSPQTGDDRIMRIVPK